MDVTYGATIAVTLSNTSERKAYVNGVRVFLLEKKDIATGDDGVVAVQ